MAITSPGQSKLDGSIKNGAKVVDKSGPAGSQSSAESLLAECKRVLRLEYEAISRLEGQLSLEFAEAVLIIAACEGKLIFSGMGKAGIIAKKVAATFSSLGKASVFLHPAEASHGDLGIISSGDCVIFFSNSGESAEVSDILPAIKRLGAMIIAITGAKQSTLASFSDKILSYGPVKEACSLGLAPTTSTILMLAIGDALAVAYLETNTAFDEKAFAVYHPGGSLGKRFKHVHEKMRSGEDVVAVHGEVKVQDILLKMTAARTGVAVVCNAEGGVIGIFSDGDLRRLLPKGLEILKQPIKAVISGKVTVVQAQMYIADAIELMRGLKIGDLPVVDRSGVLQGVLCLKDIS